MIDPTEILGTDKCFAIQQMIKKGDTLEYIKEYYKHSHQKSIDNYYKRIVSDKRKIYDEEEYTW